MDYKLFDDYITLQALLKDLGIISSGGAIKAFLADNTVLFNGQEEHRRGKKIRIGDHLALPKQDLSITLVAPSPDEIALHQEEQEEKARVAQLVKQLNQDRKKSSKKGQDKNSSQAPVRFPGT